MGSHERRTFLALGLGLGLAACSGPGASPEDASAAIDGAALPDAGPQLSAVALPDWGECPAGWLAQSVDGASICAPPARVACDATSFQRVASAACEPVDDACASTGFRAALPTDRPFVYVDSSAAAGGDGSEAHPFQTLDEALAAGTSPLGIALAAGSYTQSHALPADVALYGACASAVRVVGAAGGAAVLVRTGTRAHLEGLTLTGDGFGLATAGTTSLRAVIVTGARSVGVGGLGGTVALERVLVRGTRTADDGTFGRGISIAMATRATLDDVVVEDSRDSGISVEGATLTGTRVAVSGTTPNGLGRFGIGVSGFGSATITLGDAVISGSSLLGIEDDTSELSLDRVVVRGEGTDGLGLVATSARATLTRVWVDGAAGAAVAATSSHSVLSASDLVVTSTRARDGSGGAIGATSGTHVTLARAMVRDSAGGGVVVLGSQLDATDLTVHGVTTATDLGQALLVGQASLATVERFEFVRAQTVAVMVTSPSTTATLRDGVVADVAPGITFDVGRGIEVDLRASLTLERVVVRGAVETGIVSFGDGETATLVARDVRVAPVAERACATTSCPTEGGGTGVTALGGGTIDATNLQVEGAPLCGVQVAEGGSLDVRSGSIAHSAIGACVQVDGYDLSRILAGVSFVDNERNVETADVYVPPPLPTL